jgi:C-terminal processing protease CtpA/Prc
VKYLGQDNFDWRVVTDNYIPQHYYSSGPFQHDFLNNTNNEIGYIRFSSFTGTVNDDNLNFILERYKNTKGLILDLRENGGGAVNDLYSILSRFVEDETIIFYSRLKTGKGHDDFSEEMPAKLEPSDEIRYKNKVCVLVDRGTFSSGSYTSLSTKAIPNMILVGDTTGGGLGLPNGGQLPNGWTYRFSITQALDLNKENKYEAGVPPDVYSLFDWTDLTTDEVIEQAKVELYK